MRFKISISAALLTAFLQIASTCEASTSYGPYDAIQAPPPPQSSPTDTPTQDGNNEVGSRLGDGEGRQASQETKTAEPSITPKNAPIDISIYGATPIPSQPEQQAYKPPVPVSIAAAIPKSMYAEQGSLKPSEIQTSHSYSGGANVSEKVQIKLFIFIVIITAIITWKIIKTIMKSRAARIAKGALVLASRKAGALAKIAEDAALSNKNVPKD